MRGGSDLVETSAKSNAILVREVDVEHNDIDRLLEGQSPRGGTVSCGPNYRQLVFGVNTGRQCLSEQGMFRNDGDLGHQEIVAPHERGGTRQMTQIPHVAVGIGSGESNPWRTVRRQPHLCTRRRQLIS